MIKFLIYGYFIALFLYVMALILTLPTNPENIVILIIMIPLAFATYLIFSS